MSRQSYLRGAGQIPGGRGGGGGGGGAGGGGGGAACGQQQGEGGGCGRGGETKDQRYKTRLLHFLLLIEHVSSG